MGSFKAGSEIFCEALQCGVEAFAVEPGLIHGIEKEPRFTGAGQPSFEKLCAIAVKSYLNPLVSKFLNAQKKGWAAPSLENIALMPELFGFSARGFGELGSHGAAAATLPN
jgi:hypothetical protein